MIRFASSAALAVMLIAGCGDNIISGPFDKLPLDGDITEPGLSGPVHVARDRYGIPHISGDTVADVAFAQGYVTAHDRLPQMDILRRYGAGTLSELYGALDPTVIDTDLQMRVHRMKPLSQETWDTLQASSDPVDQEVVTLLQRFSDGVNAYARDVRANKWDLDPNVLVSFDPARFVDWTPVDSLVLGRFQAYSLSYTAEFDVIATELYQDLRTTFDKSTAANPAAFARRGISRDLAFFTEPVGDRSTIDGFPNVDPDTGTRADGGRPNSARSRSRAATATAPGPARPTVPREVFDNARRFLSTDVHDGPFGALGPRSLGHPYSGSNSWAVSPSLAGGKALLANDPHLQLPNPSLFYPVHLIVTGQLDAGGVTFPGIPGLLLGSNGNVAWGATVSQHDVNDAYLETIAPCSGGNCVTFQGAQVPIQTFTEQIQIGALGTITQTLTATYEVVPHHGPIIPTIVNHAIVPRTSATAISVRYTGYDPTFEIRALWNLAHAATVDDGFKAFSDFSYGSQNWTLIDNSGNIGWTSNANVPVRAPAAFTWDPVTNPDGLAPFFVLPGDGTAEWQGRLSSRYIPHAINPASGYLVTANADPVGATFDGNPLGGTDQPVVDGGPLYVGVSYDSGLREDRISTLIDQQKAAGPLTLAGMATIQHDTNSNVGTHLVPPVLAALARVASPTGAPSDVAPYVAGLSSADRQRLVTAKGLLAAWTLATPAATTGTPTAAELGDSAATALFNTWMHFFLERALKDEFDAMGFDMWRLGDDTYMHIANALLLSPSTFVQSPTTHQPILCDSYATAGPDDSCTKVILQSMVDAMTYLESTPGFGTADPTQWHWGTLHHYTMKPLFPNGALNLPTDSAGFAKDGDNMVVDRSADDGWSDLDFAASASGPAQRMLAEATPGLPIKVELQLPGGTIFDSRSPHYRDLLDTYYLPGVHFSVPFSIDEIVGAGEDRWLFHQ